MAEYRAAGRPRISRWRQTAANSILHILFFHIFWPSLELMALVFVVLSQESQESQESQLSEERQLSGESQLSPEHQERLRALYVDAT